MSRSLLRAGAGSFLGSVLSGDLFKKRTWSNGGFQEGYSSKGKKLKRQRSSASSGGSVGHSQIISTQSQIMPKRGTSLRALVYRAGKGKGMKRSKRSFKGKRRVRNSKRKNSKNFTFRTIEVYSYASYNQPGYNNIEIILPFTIKDRANPLLNELLFRQAQAFTSSANPPLDQYVSSGVYNNIGVKPDSAWDMPKIPIKKDFTKLKFVSLGEAKAFVSIDIFKLKVDIANLAAAVKIFGDYPDDEFQPLPVSALPVTTSQLLVQDIDFSYKRSEKLKHFATHLKQMRFTLDPGQMCTKYIQGPATTIRPIVDFQLYNNGTTQATTARDFFGTLIEGGGVYKGQHVYIIRHHGQLAKNSSAENSNTALTYCQVELGIEETHIVEYGFPVFQSNGVGSSTQLYNVTSAAGGVGKHSIVSGTGTGGKFKIVNDMLDQIEEVDDL